MVPWRLEDVFVERINWEDHPRTCKWLITMVNKSPKDRVGLAINALNKPLAMPLPKIPSYILGFV